MMKFGGLIFTVLAVVASGCTCRCDSSRIVVIDPGHFHASLALKHHLDGVSDEVSVYAPEGKEVDDFLAAVESFNESGEVSWKCDCHIGDDYLSALPKAGKGDMVILAGNNELKSEYILESVRKGYNVLSDKPMAISSEGYAMLEKAYGIARKKGLVIYDLMTERYDTLNLAARRILSDREIFGEITGASMSSVHHFCKIVNGTPTRRPEWYYDVQKQGEGIADVTTHLIDIFFWQCFPDQPVPVDSILMKSASHFPSIITPEQFHMSTGGNVESCMEVLCNGSMDFCVSGIPVRIEVRWDFIAPEGTGDTYEACIYGSKAALKFVQNESTGYVRELFLEKDGCPVHIGIPVEARIGHEDHFSKVAEAFLGCIRNGNMPEWESVNTLTKYYITTRAVEMANE
ncbi:MAG: oxidoreductase [Bacteroidales bacterium]|nr:oxidoreductase [Bacteroidales bacterium]